MLYSRRLRARGVAISTSSRLTPVCEGIRAERSVCFLPRHGLQPNIVTQGHLFLLTIFKYAQEFLKPPMECC
jgi:hypothetical protein